MACLTRLLAIQTVQTQSVPNYCDYTINRELTTDETCQVVIIKTVPWCYNLPIWISRADVRL